MATLNFFVTGVAAAVKSYTATTPITVKPCFAGSTTFEFSDVTGDKIVTATLPFIVED